MRLFEWTSTFFISAFLRQVLTADDDFNILNKDGSYEFSYNNPDSFHYSQANRNNVVKGRFGGRNPETGAIDTTVYTAGPRGYRPRGKNIVRNYDLSQSGPRAIGSKDDPYFDPSEDPSYNFGFRTPTYSRQESANRLGDITGRYTYFDDENDRHDVQYIAGRNTGFHVLTPFPDSNPRSYGNGYFRGRGNPPRGRTSIQRGLDGSYRFVSAGPDQRRTETSDAVGNVRGSYTYLDEKGVQHAVHYIAGPGIGYRVLKNVKGPHLPTIYPFGRPEIIPPDFYESVDKDLDSTDLFDTAASGHVKPIDNNIGTKPETQRPTSVTKPGGSNNFFGVGVDNGGKPGGLKPSIDYDEDIGFDELFQSKPPAKRPTTTTVRPSVLLPSGGLEEDDGSYKPEKYGDNDKLGRPSQSKPGGIIEFGDTNKTPASTSRPIGTGIQLGTKPSRPDTQIFGAEGGTGSKPLPGLDESNFDDFDFDFKPAGSGRPVLQLGVGGTSTADLGSTVVKNLGDTLFTVPPGAAVRAHVQSIDLFPLRARTPSPSEQYQLDTSHVSEQLNAETSNFNQNINANLTHASSANATNSSTTTADVTTTSTFETTTVIVETTTSSKNVTDVS